MGLVSHEEEPDGLGYTALPMDPPGSPVQHPIPPVQVPPSPPPPSLLVRATLLTALADGGGVRGGGGLRLPQQPRHRIHPRPRPQGQPTAPRPVLRPVP